ADRNRSHWSTSKTPSYTKSVSWQHHPNVGEITKVTDNLFTAVIDRFADYSRANEYSREGWQAIINNAVVVM
ncbi:hypothetical protein RZQ04_24415, partial [Escherichia coli]|nr:hypothetical protein [Escherichia coli]